jgi:LmbE family N-acetylglucosaminyl deacetylase
MARVFFYSPHPDDETLSMGLAMIYYIAAGSDVHLVSMNNGGALGAANTLNGVTACSIPADHPYTHSPAREGFAPLAVPDVAAARIKEARGALGAMAMIAPPPPPVGGGGGGPSTTRSAAVSPAAAGLHLTVGGPPVGAGKRVSPPLPPPTAEVGLSG